MMVLKPIDKYQIICQCHNFEKKHSYRLVIAIAKYLAKSFLMQNNSKSFSSINKWCHSVNYNYIIGIAK